MALGIRFEAAALPALLICLFSQTHGYGVAPAARRRVQMPLALQWKNDGSHQYFLLAHPAGEPRGPRADGVPLS